MLVGKEGFLREGYTRTLLEKVRAGGEEPEVFRFDGAADEPAEVYDECRSFSLMGGYKVVVVDNADQLVVGEKRPLAERYAVSPADGVTLVLRCDSWNKGKKLDDPIRAIGGFISCDEVTEGKAAGWVIRRGEHLLGVRVDDEAARMLVEQAGVGLGRLATELDKLAALVGSGETVTAEHVAEMTGRTREESIWAMQAPLLRGDLEGALAMIDEVMASAGGSAVPARWALADLARKLHVISAGVAERTPAREAAKAAKLWGSALDEHAAIGARLRPEAAAGLYRAAVEADFRGKTSAGDEKIGLEALSVRFCETLRAAGAAR